MFAARDGLLWMVNDSKDIEKTMPMAINQDKRTDFKILRKEKRCSKEGKEYCNIVYIVSREWQRDRSIHLHRAGQMTINLTVKSIDMIVMGLREAGTRAFWIPTYLGRFKQTSA